MKILDLLIDFVLRAKESKIGRSEWLFGEELQVYMRKSKRLVNNKYVDSLDIANIEVYDKGKGTFTSFLSDVHAINPFDITLDRKSVV